MSWPLVLLVAAPVMAGLGSLLVQQRRAIEVLQCALAGTMLATAALVAGQVIAAGEVSVGDFLQADALSAWLDLILGFVGSSGTLYAVGYVGEEMDRGHLSLRRYSQFLCLFDLNRRRLHGRSHRFLCKGLTRPVPKARPRKPARA